MNSAADVGLLSDKLELMKSGFLSTTSEEGDGERDSGGGPTAGGHPTPEEVRAWFGPEWAEEVLTPEERGVRSSVEAVRTPEGEAALSSGAAVGV